MRQCALTRQRAPQASLLRLVLSEDGTPHVDVRGRAPGRGVYVAAERDVLKQALTPKGLGRLFKGKARMISDEEGATLTATLRSQLTDRILDLVGLARRAGALEMGMDAVTKTALPSASVLLVTEDLSTRSRRAVDAISAEHSMICVGTKQELGRRLGREAVGIVAVRPSTFAERLRSEAARYDGLFGVND